MRKGLAILLCLLALCGCNDDKKNPTGSNDDNDTEHDGTITATITGDIEITFNCSDAYGLKLDPQDGASGSMHIQGDVTQGSDTYMIDIQVYRDPATGTYQLTFPPDEGIGSLVKNAYAHYSDSGSITFTQVNSARLAGAFSFHAFRLVEPGVMAEAEVAQGTFNVPVIYEEQPSRAHVEVVRSSIRRGAS